MIRLLGLSTLLWAFVGFCFAGSDLEIGQSLYERRASGASDLKVHPATIDQAIQHFQKALDQKPMGEEAAIYLLKSYLYRGQFASKDADEEKAVFTKAKEYGERLLKQYPNSAGVQFYSAANLGKWAEGNGVIAAARAGVADKLKESAEKIIELDPNYEQGAGYYLLGIIHYKTPRIPLILTWPDNEKALTYLRKALELNPDRLSIQIALAEALLKTNKKQEALLLLRDVSQKNPLENHLLEDRRDIAEATP
jgi:tetratricopeptide (TPR) repeat protein